MDILDGLPPDFHPFTTINAQHSLMFDGVYNLLISINLLIKRRNEEASYVVVGSSSAFVAQSSRNKGKKNILKIDLEVGNSKVSVVVLEGVVPMVVASR